MHKSLLIERKSHIATLTLNRPEVNNAFDENLITALTKALQDIDKDSEIRVVHLAAKGKYFSAGADLNSMQKMAEYSFEENIEDARKLSLLMQTLRYLSKPTIAIVQGSAFGGALGLIACCDIAIASEDSKFCFSEVKLGLAPAVISPYIIETMGERAARRYFLTAELFTAQQAKEIGLIHEIAKKNALDQIIQKITLQLLNNSPAAMTAAKQLLPKIDKHWIDETVQRLATIRISAEAQEGLKAFLAKRQPSWQMKQEQFHHEDTERKKKDNS